MKSRQILTAYFRTTFIRQSLATCLLLYGCDREALKSGGIILEEEIKVLVSRKVHLALLCTIDLPISFLGGNSTTGRRC